MNSPAEIIGFLVPKFFHDTPHNRDIDIEEVMALLDALELADAEQETSQFRKIEDVDNTGSAAAVSFDFSDLADSAPEPLKDAALVKIEDRSLFEDKLTSLTLPSVSMEQTVIASQPTDDPLPASKTPARPLLSPTPASSLEGLSHLELIRTGFAAWRAKHSDLPQIMRSHAKRLETMRLNQEKQEARAARLKPTPWARLSDLDRLPYYSSAILNTGCAVAFTLNISRTLADRASKEASGPLDYLRRIVMRRLKDVFLKETPRLVVALEFAKDGRPHLHGFVEWKSRDLHQLRDALKIAGGTWGARRGGRHQVHVVSDQFELRGNNLSATDKALDVGWIHYCTKYAKNVRDITNHSPIYASLPAKNAAMSIYAKSIALRALN